MTKRMLYLFSALLIFAFSVGLTGAAPLKPRPKPVPRSTPVKVFTGTFVNPAGRSHRIQIVDGGNINIANREKNLFYRLSARTGEDGTAEVTLEQYLDADYSTMVGEERMNVSLDGRTKRSSLGSFRFSLDGERHTRAVLRTGPAPTKAIGGECCIDCGDGWVVCCGVAIFEPGWIACCSIDTWCAWCDVCAWWIS